MSVEWNEGEETWKSFGFICLEVMIAGSVLPPSLVATGKYMTSKKYQPQERNVRSQRVGRACSWLLEVYVRTEKPIRVTVRSEATSSWAFERQVWVLKKLHVSVLSLLRTTLPHLCLLKCPHLRATLPHLCLVKFPHLRACSRWLSVHSEACQ